ncbi:hypothetical protein C7T35_28260 [Variovorax sp. WS11]|uniref:hypothetical protein n=1 Tax=Variovorax sp. WS11 TaxID=1105204 RepID=UPI000D0E08FB|nr:hypothetical protein [Variovorax sp. WS11]NDZ14187.1 hypothetical protein [Variovorax sp. WS11]PSL81191.1 hypothetical protein C7T35_28260 [Variovorax sp. WS11]
MIFGTKQDERPVAARATQAQTQTPSADARVPPDDLDQPVVAQNPLPADGADDDALAPLFTTDATRDFRARWDAVQIGFVDDPKQAVRDADELVRQMLQNLAQTFSEDRAGLDAQGDGAADTGSTEKLRLALRRYRAFMQRLLSL